MLRILSSAFQSTHDLTSVESFQPKNWLEQWCWVRLLCPALCWSHGGSINSRHFLKQTRNADFCRSESSECGTSYVPTLSNACKSATTQAGKCWDGPSICHKLGRDHWVDPRTAHQVFQRIGSHYARNARRL